MNKAELIATVAEKTGLSKKDSEKAVNATFDTITANLEVGEKVQGGLCSLGKECLWR